MKSSSKVFSWGFTLGVVAALGLAWVNRLAVYDWFRLRNYEPTPAVMQLADQTTMNDSARNLFYVQHPELNGPNQFNKNCGNHGEHTIVLGCYVPGRGIYIYDVEDDRLKGVEQVTAAHELLHVAYERLSENERKDIDRLVNETYERLSNERITSAVESYRQRDPSVVPNEMHSIIGTEVRSLPEELEAYYSRYFENRAQIVNYAEEYESVLTARRNKADTLDLQIRGLKNEINLLESTLAEQRAQLEADRPDIETQEEADAFNEQVRQYNTNIVNLNSLIEEHNRLVKEYEENALEYQELYDSLNSKPTL